MMGGIWLSREELYERIWAAPTTQLAAELGISDVGLGKICKRMRIPKPPAGYWRRIATGKEVPRTPLPEAKQDVVLNMHFPGKRPNIVPQSKFQLTNPDLLTQIEAERNETKRITVADTLGAPHLVVRRTHQAYKKAYNGPKNLDSQWV